MRRIERLINLIIALLNTRVPITTEQIRAGVAGYDEQPTEEAFRRAFERDKAELRAMGIPIEVRKLDPLDDHSDAYSIPRDRYYLPDLKLRPEEVAALRLASEAVVGGRGRAAAGIMKISADVSGAPLEGARVSWGADLAVEQPLLSALYEAQLERAPVRFNYVKADGESSERTVEPYALVNRRGHWYVVGRDADRDAERAFRLSRIKGDIEQLEGNYAIPPDFDPRAKLPGQAWEIGDRPLEATVRFDAELRWWAEQNLSEASMREGPGGALDATLPVSNLDALVSWIIGFGARAEIIAPDEARARLLDHLEPLTGKRRA